MSIRLAPHRSEDQGEVQEDHDVIYWRRREAADLAAIQEDCETDDQKAQRLKAQREFDRDEARRTLSLAHLGGRITQRHLDMADYVDRRIWEGAGCDEGLESGLSGAWMRRLQEKHAKAHQIKNEYWRHVTRARIWKEIWGKVEEYELPQRRRYMPDIENNMHLFPAPERPDEGGFWKASGETTRVFPTRWRYATTKGRQHWSWGAKRAFTVESAGVRTDVCGTQADREVVWNTSTKAKRDF